MNETELRRRISSRPSTDRLFDELSDREFFEAWEDPAVRQSDLAERWGTGGFANLANHARTRYAFTGRDPYLRRGVRKRGDLSELGDTPFLTEWDACENPFAEMPARHDVSPRTAKTYARLVFARHGREFPVRSGERERLRKLGDEEYLRLWEDPSFGLRGIRAAYGVLDDAAQWRAGLAYAGLGREPRTMFDLGIDWRQGTPNEPPAEVSVPFGLAELNYVTSMLECGRTLAEAAEGLAMTENDVSGAYAVTGIDVSEGWPFEQRGVWNAGPAGHRSLDEGTFDIVDTPAKAWLLGLILADGSLSLDPREGYEPVIEVSLKYRDADAVFAARDVLGSGVRIDFQPYRSEGRKSGTRARLQVRSCRLFGRLGELGLGERKSLTVGMPDWLTPELAPHFFRGVWDGDGSVVRGRSGRHWLSLIGSIPFIEAAIGVLPGLAGVAPTPVLDKRHPNVLALSVQRREEVGRLVRWMWPDGDTTHPALGRKRRAAMEALAWTEAESDAERHRARVMSRRHPAFAGVTDADFTAAWEDPSLSLNALRLRYGVHYPTLRRHARVVYAAAGLEPRER